MTSGHDFWVYIEGQRGEEWKQILGTNRIPVKTPIPELGNLPGLGTQQIYMLAFEALPDGDLEKIIAQLAAKFGMTEAETKDEFVKVGIPILADNCIRVIHNPQRWLDASDDD